MGGAEADGKIQPSGNPPDMPGQKLESTGSWNQQQGDQIDEVYTSIEVQPRQKYADNAAKQQKQD